MASKPMRLLPSRYGRCVTSARILDVGCGTGKQLAPNRRGFAGMLMRSDAFHYVTSQFAYPHVRQTELLLKEVFRALKAGGRFVMTNIDPWSMARWLLYQYFPEALDLDRQDFMQVESVIGGERLDRREGLDRTGRVGQARASVIFSLPPVLPLRNGPC